MRFTKDSTEESKASGTQPTYLRQTVLAGFVAVFASLIVSIVVLFSISERNYGLATSSSSLHYLWTYGTDSNNHCSCGERKTPQHIFFCRRLRGHRLLPRNAPRVAYTQFLGEESRKWARFVEDSKFFTNICPR